MDDSCGLLPPKCEKSVGDDEASSDGGAKRLREFEKVPTLESPPGMETDDDLDFDEKPERLDDDLKKFENVVAPPPPVATDAWRELSFCEFDSRKVR